MSDAVEKEKVDTLRRLGATVPYPYPVPPRRDRYGAAWCPCCAWSALVEPIDKVRFDAATPCSECGQQLDWSSWSTLLSAEELRQHETMFCSAPTWCFRCLPQRAQR